MISIKQSPLIDTLFYFNNFFRLWILTFSASIALIISKEITIIQHSAPHFDGSPRYLNQSCVASTIDFYPIPAPPVTMARLLILIYSLQLSLALALKEEKGPSNCSGFLTLRFLSIVTVSISQIMLAIFAVGITVTPVEITRIQSLTFQPIPEIIKDIINI